MAFATVRWRCARWGLVRAPRSAGEPFHRAATHRPEERLGSCMSEKLPSGYRLTADGKRPGSVYVVPVVRPSVQASSRRSVARGERVARPSLPPAEGSGDKTDRYCGRGRAAAAPDGTGRCCPRQPVSGIGHASVLGSGHARSGFRRREYGPGVRRVLNEAVRTAIILTSRFCQGSTVRQQA